VHVCGLCRSQLFYYSAGISFGLLASLLILVYMVSKIMPKVSVRLSGGARSRSSIPVYTCTVVVVRVLACVALRVGLCVWLCTEQGLVAVGS